MACAKSRKLGAGAAYVAIGIWRQHQTRVGYRKLRNEAVWERALAKPTAGISPKPRTGCITRDVSLARARVYVRAWLYRGLEA